MFVAAFDEHYSFSNQRHLSYGCLSIVIENTLRFDGFFQYRPSALFYYYYSIASSIVWYLFALG